MKQRSGLIIQRTADTYKKRLTKALLMSILKSKRFLYLWSLVQTNGVHEIDSLRFTLNFNTQLYAHISHLTSHISYLTSHISHLTSHISHLTSHISHLISHISYLSSHISHLKSHLFFTLLSFVFTLNASSHFCLCIKRSPLFSVHLLKIRNFEF